MHIAMITGHDTTPRPGDGPAQLRLGAAATYTSAVQAGLFAGTCLAGAYQLTGW